jgi:hypothetical protein
MVVDVFGFWNMKLDCDLIIKEEHMLNVLHFFPSRASIVTADAYVIPITARGCDDKEFLFIDRRPNNKSPACMIAVIAIHTFNRCSPQSISLKISEIFHRISRVSYVASPPQRSGL